MTAGPMGQPPAWAPGGPPPPPPAGWVPAPAPAGWQAPPSGWQPPPSGLGAWEPTPAAAPVAAGANRRLLIAGVGCVTVTIASIVLRQVGLLPSGLATVVVLVAVGIALRFYVSYASRSASSAHGARIAKLIALAGLGVSAVSVVGALPVLLHDGGTGTFVANVVAHLWTIGLLLLAAGPARTLGWMVPVGMGVTGFLAVTGFAYTVTRPLVDALGATSTLAVAVVAPVVEEVLKAVPVLLLVVFAARRTTHRPSAVELAFVGACVGAGFALYEDARFLRGGFHFAMPPLSLLNPSASNDFAYGVTYFVGGHMVYTALMSFGIAFAALYRRRLHWAPIAGGVAVVLPIVEHVTQNYSTVASTGTGSTAVFNLLRVVTLWGWASSLLLVVGVVFVARLEWRAVDAGERRPLQDRLLATVWLTRAAAARTAGALARLQASATSAADRPTFPGGPR